MAMKRRSRISRKTRWTLDRFAFPAVALSLALALVFLFHSWLNKEIENKCEWIDKPPLVCAHGGDTSEAPPNTFAAYKLALDAGVDCMEIDVSRTLDDILVTLHNRELNNMANTSGLSVGDLTYDQIQQFDAGLGFPEQFRGQKVPSLDSTLRYISGAVKQVIVDVKVGPPAYATNLAMEVKDAVERARCTSCVVWSKVDEVVHSLRLLSRKTTAGYIVMDDSSNAEMQKPLRISSATVVGTFHKLVSKEFVSSVHRAGKQVHAWTVNDEEDMIRVLQLGVDCIITSQPRLLQQVMSRLRVECSLI